MLAIELFAGIGGLSLGVNQGGFRPISLIEQDSGAIATIQKNIKRGIFNIADWPIVQADIKIINWETYPTNVDLLSAGPPCQPFSLGGKHKRDGDDRYMFDDLVNAIYHIQPKAFLIENVKGLARSAWDDYFSYLLLKLSFPAVHKKANEDWSEHLGRLHRAQTSGRYDCVNYNLVWKVVNAANYGVPQRRERIFIVGFRNDIDANWAFPKETHSLEALFASQHTNQTYWERHVISKSMRPDLRRLYGKSFSRLERTSEDREKLPWNTVRDALSGLPNPKPSEASAIYADHFYQPGAKSYRGHTGSPVDLPAKALKAGIHGVPGGENMMVMPNGDIRYFTIREAARLQTFPDDFVFCGSWTKNTNHLGNAVPVALAQIMAKSIRECLVD